MSREHGILSVVPASSRAGARQLLCQWSDRSTRGTVILPQCIHVTSKAAGDKSQGAASATTVQVGASLVAPSPSSVVVHGGDASDGGMLLLGVAAPAAQQALGAIQAWAAALGKSIDTLSPSERASACEVGLQHLQTWNKGALLVNGAVAVVRVRKAQAVASSLGKELGGVQGAAAKLGLTVAKEWPTLLSPAPLPSSGVTHVLMRTLQPTAKFLRALLEGARVVTPAWVHAVAAQCSTSPLCVSEEGYLPLMPDGATLSQHQVAWSPPTAGGYGDTQASMGPSTARKGVGGQSVRGTSLGRTPGTCPSGWHPDHLWWHADMRPIRERVRTVFPQGLTVISEQRTALHDILLSYGVPAFCLSPPDGAAVEPHVQSVLHECALKEAAWRDAAGQHAQGKGTGILIAAGSEVSIHADLKDLLRKMRSPFAAGGYGFFAMHECHVLHAIIACRDLIEVAQDVAHGREDQGEQVPATTSPTAKAGGTSAPLPSAPPPSASKGRRGTKASGHTPTTAQSTANAHTDAEDASEGVAQHQTVASARKRGRNRGSSEDSSSTGPTGGPAVIPVRDEEDGPAASASIAQQATAWTGAASGKRAQEGNAAAPSVHPSAAMPRKPLPHSVVMDGDSALPSGPGTGRSGVGGQGRAAAQQVREWSEEGDQAPPAAKRSKPPTDSGGSDDHAHAQADGIGRGRATGQHSSLSRQAEGSVHWDGEQEAAVELHEDEESAGRRQEKQAWRAAVLALQAAEREGGLVGPDGWVAASRTAQGLPLAGVGTNPKPAAIEPDLVIPIQSREERESSHGPAPVSDPSRYTSRQGEPFEVLPASYYHPTTKAEECTGQGKRFRKVYGYRYGPSGERMEGGGVPVSDLHTTRAVSATTTGGQGGQRGLRTVEPYAAQAVSLADTDPIVARELDEAMQAVHAEEAREALAEAVGTTTQRSEVGGKGGASKAVLSVPVPAAAVKRRDGGAATASQQRLVLPTPVPLPTVAAMPPPPVPAMLGMLGMARPPVQATNRQLPSASVARRR